MTTIATDGKTIAADTLRVCGGEIIDRDTRKIVMFDDKVFAFTGDFGFFSATIDWYLHGACAADAPKVSKDSSWRLLVCESKHIMSYTDTLPWGEPFPYPTAFGSGACYAQAALVLGKSPAEAVALAMQLDIYTGGRVVEVAIPRALAEAAE